MASHLSVDLVIRLTIEFTLSYADEKEMGFRKLAFSWCFLLLVTFCLPPQSLRASDKTPLPIPMRADPNFVNENTRKNSPVHYFTPEEMKQYVVTIREGRLYDQEGKPLSSRRDRFSIYTIEPDLSLKITNFPSQNFIHHSSLTRGGPVIAAGQVLVENGRILAIDRHSGHYRPDSSRLDWVKKYLKERGISLSPEHFHRLLPDYYLDQLIRLELANCARKTIPLILRP